jgi:putative protease
MPNHKPEVLAPAGTPEALQAAVGAGADAVYFGLHDWNARIRARNFELGDLPDILRDLRQWGVKSYLAFNTLVFHEEMAGARDALEAIAQAGPDGIIVQDLGILRLARTVAPSLKVHASTQMTVASPDGVRLVSALGAHRVILARELTIPEIARIRASVDTELEVFVHGALCVSYSGQCLSSEAWGGRSANRGQCAQACRLPYDLMVDGKRRNLGDRAYLLSPRDLEGWRRIPELTALGMAAFKIEGRMKSPEYVSAATALYREAVDRAWESLQRQPGDEPVLPRQSLGRLAAESRQVFSRGVSEGFLGGVNHQLLADGTTRAHRGPRVGTVLSLEIDARGGPRGVVMEEAAPESGAARVTLKPGDGVLFAVTSLEEDEVGGRLLSADPVGRAGHRILEFPRVSMPDLARVKPGTPIYRTSDPALMERLRRDLGHPERKRQVPLQAVVKGAEGEPLTLRLTDPEGRTVEVESLVPLDPATQRALDAAGLHEQMERMGGTRYRIAHLDVQVGERVFLPVSELNRIRRDAVEMMEELRGASPGFPPQGAVPPLGSVSAKVAVPPWGGVPPQGADVAGVAGGEGVGAGALAQAAPSAAEELPSPVIWALDRAEHVEVVTPGAVAGSPADPDLAPPRVATPSTGSPDEIVAGSAEAGTQSSAPREYTQAAIPETPLSFEDAFIVLCRAPEQVRGAVDAGARRIALDFLDLVGLKEASRDLAAAGVRRTLALPRVQKPGEERIESFFLGLGPEEILVRSLGSIERLRRLRAEFSERTVPNGSPAPRGGTPPSGGTAGGGAGFGGSAFPLLVGDVSLNAVNPDAVEILLGLGLDRVTPGMDLNGEQLESLVEAIALGAGAARCEISVHHHLPLFHTEHCVFAAFLSDGADFRTCGRPCDRHRIALRDRTGQMHPVEADVGCRNTVFGVRPLSALAHLAALRRAGVGQYRVEMITQDRRGAARLVEVHRSVWEGRVTVVDAQKTLQTDSAYGISLGSPEPPRAPVSRPAGSRAKPAGAGTGKARPRAPKPDRPRQANRSHAGEGSREPRWREDRRERPATHHAPGRHAPGGRGAAPSDRSQASDRPDPSGSPRPSDRAGRSGPSRSPYHSAQSGRPRPSGQARPPGPSRPPVPPGPKRPDDARPRSDEPRERMDASSMARPDGPGWFNRSDRPEGPGRSGRSAHPDRLDRPDRPTRPPRPVAPDCRGPRPQRPDGRPPRPDSAIARPDVRSPRPSRTDSRPPRPGARPARSDARPRRPDARPPRPSRPPTGPRGSVPASRRGDDHARVRPRGPSGRSGKPGRPGPRRRET